MGYRPKLDILRNYSARFFLTPSLSGGLWGGRKLKDYFSIVRAAISTFPWKGKEQEGAAQLTFFGHVDPFNQT